VVVLLEYNEKTEDYLEVATRISSGPLHEGDLTTGTSFEFELALPPDALSAAQAAVSAGTSSGTSSFHVDRAGLKHVATHPPAEPVPFDSSPATKASTSSGTSRLESPPPGASSYSVPASSCRVTLPLRRRPLSPTLRLIEPPSPARASPV
jgi:hypothetical protein